ncbi:ComEC/Rec2 family competence protein [Thalassobacillus pellis]|uniref:ComEC/Rec2 family competence protein n=1 Tax=Thalassobacillus pellis TaxID=748008 RepID=UPI00195F3253|nr:hypothetical protein [Thalassobacillus pellis]MBM7552493.1 beta-lactamase superfamily II metal-dependent hydrolase [Thalassobacillus pellis]
MLKNTILSLLILIIGTSPNSQSLLEPYVGNEARITFFGLPDGEATLLETDQQDNYLINTGDEESYHNLTAELDELGVKKINGIILTGETDDYCGNLAKLIETYKVKTVFHTGKWERECTKGASIKHIRWSENDQVQWGEVHVQVVYTDEQVMDVLLTIYNTGVLFLTKGNIEEELHILKKNLPFEILKVGAYGSGQSPSGQFLDETDPHLGIVFSRRGIAVNDGLMERLQGYWMDLYRLKQTGTTTIEINEEQYSVPSD